TDALAVRRPVARHSVSREARSDRHARGVGRWRLPGPADGPDVGDAPVGERALPQPESGTSAGAEHVVGPGAGVVRGPGVGELSDAAHPDPRAHDAAG